MWIKRADLEIKNGYESAIIGDGRRQSKKTTTEESEMLTTYKVNLDAQRLSISTRKGLLWASGANEAILKGNILHEYLSLIEYSSDFKRWVKR